MSDPRTDLPSVSAPNFNQRLRETIQTYLGKQGNPLDRGLTLRDLIENGLVKIRDGFTLRSGQGALPLGPGSNIEEAYDPDLTPPPTPAGFSVDAAISHVFVEHDAPIYRQGHGHLRTRLYGKIVNTGDPLPTFADAVEIAQFAGTVYAHPSNPATTWRLWIKWETVDGVLSVDPAGGTNGLEAITGQDVSRLVKAMTGPGNPFKVVPEQFTLPDGTVIPAGTYTADAFIHNGQITNAKIAKLAVDDAKIASLSAGKLNAGYINSERIEAGSIDAKLLNVDAAVITKGYLGAARIEDGSITNAHIGNNIESADFATGSTGWRIQKDGQAELNNAVFRGTIDVKSAATGARLQISSNVIQVYDGSGTLRVKIGDLSA